MDIKKNSIELMKQDLVTQIESFKREFNVSNVNHNKNGIHVTVYIPYETASKLKGAVSHGILDNMTDCAEGIVWWVNDLEEKHGSPLPMIDPKTPMKRTAKTLTPYEKTTRQIVRSLQGQLSLLEALEKEVDTKD